MNSDAPKRKSALPLWFLAASVGGLIIYLGIRTANIHQTGKETAGSVMTTLKNDMSLHWNKRIPDDAPIDLAPFLIKFGRVLEINELDETSLVISRYILATECKRLVPRHEGLLQSVNDYFRGACKSRAAVSCKKGLAPVIISRYWPDVDKPDVLKNQRYPDFSKDSSAKERSLVAATMCIAPPPQTAAAPEQVKPPLRIELLMAFSVSGVLSYETSWHELKFESPPIK